MEPMISYKYDSRKASLAKLQTIELTHNKKTVGHRRITDEYDKPGSVELVKTLNAQKNQFGAQLKEIQKNLEAFKDVKVDEEFLKKFEAMTNMQKKIETQEALKNTEKAIKQITKELLDIKKTGFNKK